MSLPRKVGMVVLMFACGWFVPSSANAGGKVVLSKTDQLASDDEKDTNQLTNNSPRKVYKLQLKEGKTYRIELKSKAFDAVLRLENAGGKEVAFNDDAPGAETLDSLVEFKAPKSEEYKIIATCLDGKAGKFTLTVTEAGGAIAVGDTKGKLLFSKNEDLSDQDRKDSKMSKSYAKTYTVTLKKDGAYRIDLDSKDFDTFLRLEDASGKEVAFNDDIALPANLNSRLIYVAPKDGEYKIVVTTYEPGKTGAFRLSMMSATETEAAEARFIDRVERFGDLAAKEQKALLTEFETRLMDKDGKLDIKDAQLAITVAFASDDGGIDAARPVYQSLVKIFSGAEAKQVASVAVFLEREFKKLEKFYGKEFPVSGKTVDGKDYDLKNMKGKVVLIDFWATWCGPCIAELPNMETAYKNFHGKGFDIIGISLDRPNDDEKLSKFIKNRKMPWPCINIEDSRGLAEKYDVNSIPFPVLVDANGRVVSLRARGPQLERLLARLLPDKK